MADPWLTIVGLGEDGPAGLSAASLTALDEAEVVMGPPRHLSLLDGLQAERVVWPAPFAKGLKILLALKPRRVVVLASGDPFWFGAGTVIARHVGPDDWRALPGPSTFSLAAARMGWPLETTLCIGLHAAPLTRLRPHLCTGFRGLVLLRDGAAVNALDHYLAGQGWQGTLTVLQALGGPRERVETHAIGAVPEGFAAPVAAAVRITGGGVPLTTASGQADDIFDTDGQLTKRPVRALTLSALAPKPGQMLWDIGGGTGTIGIEWLLSHPTAQAIAIEPRAERAARIRANADALGVDRLQVVEGSAPEALDGLAPPDVVFVGGGLSDDLLRHLETTLPPGTRLVANAVTLETEALLIAAQARLGGDLLRIELSQASPLGTRTGWKASYPVVQWSVTL